MNELLYMQRCLELAALGLGKTRSNPLVGSVIVHENRIIGEGYHMKYGEAHAEVNAINSVSHEDQKFLPSSTLYVNLEPCSHFGKTPPCSDLIIEKKIPHVVIGTIDPFAQVQGKGVEKLQNAGIDVKTGILEEKCRELNRRFFIFHARKRPYIILKWAQTKNGFICPAPECNEDKWISNRFSKTLVHKWRTEEMGILVGFNTAINDNPNLTARNFPGENPVRIVIDRLLKLPPEHQLFNSEATTLVFNEVENNTRGNIQQIKVNFSTDILPQIMEQLHLREIISIIVEGGTITLSHFIQSGLWDEARIFVGNKSFSSGIPAPLINGLIMGEERIYDDLLYYYRK